MTTLAQTTPELISLTGFHVRLAIVANIIFPGPCETNATLSRTSSGYFFALCLLAFTARIYIRLKCFRELPFEDWFMVAALACHLALAIVGQLFLVDLYALLEAENGGAIGPDFFTTSLRNVKAFGVSCILSLAGIWFIKLNFLFFFYRIGHHMRAYRICWIIAVIFNIGCGAA